MKLLGIIALAIGIFALVVSFGAWVFEFLWNWLVSDIFNIREITYWESLGIMGLLTIIGSFFGSSRSNG